MPEVRTEITCHSKRHTIEVGYPEVPFVNFEGRIEAAKVLHRCAMTFAAAVGSWFGAIEIAWAGSG
jgi:hypothetical protein